MYCWLVRGKSRIVEVDGVTLDLDLSEVIDVAVFLQRFERELVEAIHAYTKSGDVVLDVGANAGVHSMVLAKCAAPGTVFAFEPTRRAYARLQRNAALNPALHVVPIQLALSDENAAATASFRSSWRTDRVVHSDAENICFRRLDDWLEENQLERVDLVKLDVHGFDNGYSTAHPGCSQSSSRPSSWRLATITLRMTEPIQCWCYRGRVIIFGTPRPFQ